MYWKKLSTSEIKERISTALNKNINYRKSDVLGIPGTFLDPEEFYDDAPFLDNSPFLSTLIANPNHIGCHTLNAPAEPFEGTQEIEAELINLCAEEIFGGNKYEQDGYVAPGGTEANLQAMWIYRNYFMQECNASLKEIALVYSQDAHYSMSKGSDLLCIDSIVLPVHESSREIDASEANNLIKNSLLNGKKHFIFILNMGTTMFGSVDDIKMVAELVSYHNLSYKIHVDAAFGGFLYPFITNDENYSFRNPVISSFTIDAHKLLQAPYGTGIFLIRKGMMHYACTEEAKYIPGKDFTICGSRSGANAICVWMILKGYGSDGWKSKMLDLIHRTTDLCDRLTELKIDYFRNPDFNIITIPAGQIPEEIATKYLLVADNYDKPEWWKIVMMPHVKKGTTDRFINELKIELSRRGKIAS